MTLPPAVPAHVEALRFVVSGTGDLWLMQPDEAVVLREYQNVRDAGRGSLFVEFADGQATRFEVKHGGGAPLLNGLLRPTRTTTLRD